MSSDVSSSTTLPIQRFVGFDISKRTSVVAAVDAKQQVVLTPRKISIDKLELWARANLKPTDKVVIEATFNGWYYYDLLAPLVSTLLVANPHKVRLIAQSRVKTDAKDALALAKLLAAELVPTVWVPPIEVRELRSLVAHRTRLVRQAASAKTRLQVLIASYHLLPPGGDPFSAKNDQWWLELKLPLNTEFVIRHELAILQSLRPLISEIEHKLIELSNQGRWASQSAFLIQLPGIGVLTAVTILSAIGDIKRFATAKHLVGYSGLGASVHSSGQLVRTGSITKEGRRELRTALVEAAWTAVEHDSFWKGRFERLVPRLGRGKAIVAIARKLLVVIWHVLSKAQADQQANEGQVARKLLRWGYKLRAKGRKELSGAVFTRFELNWLGIGHNLTSLQWEGRTLVIPLPLSPVKDLSG